MIARIAADPSNLADPSRLLFPFLASVEEPVDVRLGLALAHSHQGEHLGAVTWHVRQPVRLRKAQVTVRGVSDARRVLTSLRFCALYRVIEGISAPQCDALLKRPACELGRPPATEDAPHRVPSGPILVSHANQPASTGSNESACPDTIRFSA